MGSPSDGELAWLPKDSDSSRFLRRSCSKSRGVPFHSLYPQASDGSLDLARQLLQWHPGFRPTAQEAQEHRYLRALLPDEPPALPEPFDWTFDKFKATVPLVQAKLYRECARYHPEILERDRDILSARRGEGLLRPPSKRPSIGAHGDAHFAQSDEVSQINSGGSGRTPVRPVEPCSARTSHRSLTPPSKPCFAPGMRVASAN